MSAVAKMRFKLLEGTHYEPNPNWKSKDESRGVLKHIKRTKNDDLGGIVESEDDLCLKFPCKFEPVVPGVNAPIIVTEARRAAVRELVASGWDSGDTEFLEELPDDGFERIQRQAQRAPKGPRKPASVFGEDVTHQFQMAYDHGYKVYCNAEGKHQVLKGSATKPMNLEPLEGDKVEDFVRTAIKTK
jgi:hypothetical protein